MRPSLILFACLLFFAGSLSAQKGRVVTGRITSTQNQSLENVTVSEKATTNTVSADASGSYSIRLTQDNSVLVFSYVGYASKEMPVGSSSSLNVTLENAATLNEVVVTGAFGLKQQKRTLGYTVQEVSSADLLQGRQNNFVDALQGKVSGVNITSSGGAPGSGADIVIRGISSLNPGANNQPLIVIDGIPVDNRAISGNLMPSTGTNLNQATSRDQFGTPNRGLDINPEDIESISVLKGAGATALYGLQAANGVLIITTKKGSTGKMTVTFSSSAAIDFITKYPEIQTKYREGQGGRISMNANGTLGTRFQSFGPLRTADEPIFYNFRDAFDNGARYNNSLSIQGGSNKTTYYSSFSALNQDGIIPSTSFDRYTFKLGGSSQVSDQINVTGSATYASSKTVSPSAGDKGMMTALTYHTPSFDVRDYINPDGTMKVYAPGIIDNPLYVARYSQMVSNVSRFFGNVGFTWNIMPNLKLDYKFGGDAYSDNRTRVVPGPLFVGAPVLDLAAAVGGFIAEERITFRDVTSNAFLTYQNKLGDDFDLSVLVGNNLQNTYTDQISARGEGFALPEFYDLSNTANLYNSRTTTRRKYAGILGNVKVGFRNALYLEVSGRNDWSSTLPKANNSFFYPSASVSYVFSQLHNISNSILNYGKLRMSYAQVGKDALPYSNGPYFISAPGFPFNSVPGSRRFNVYADSSLMPEMQRSFELGTELHFFKNRVNLDVSLYKSKNSDQILSVPISFTSGFATYITNAGALENKGIEIQLDATPVKTSSITWNAMINWSANRSKVLSIREGITEIPFYNELRVSNKLVVGGSAGDLYGIAYKRDAQGNLVIKADGRPDITSTSADQWVKVGNSIPDWQGSINNTFSWKGFSLSGLLEVRKGGDMFDVTMRNAIRNGVLKITENRYQQVIFQGVKASDGKPNDIPTILDENFYRDANVFNNIADVILQDASWIRLRNVNLTYDFPKAMFNNAKIVKTLRLGVTASNFILHTPYKGYDPQSSAFGAGYNVYGFTGSNIPNYSSVVFLLNATF